MEVLLDAVMLNDKELAPSAADSLARIRSPKANRVLLDLVRAGRFRHDVAVIESLGHAGQTAVPVLAELLANPTIGYHEHNSAMNALRIVGDAAVPAVLTLLDHLNPHVAIAVA